MAWLPQIHTGEEIPVDVKQELDGLRSMVKFLEESREELKIKVSDLQNALNQMRNEKSGIEFRLRVTTNKLAALKTKTKRRMEAEKTNTEKASKR